ncbi:hypothetical protein R50073_35820 [Maricurvus nonylphenolicus]|uniref:hypothetical protein n=1 Tax=Maricurvus nonylphenolicus TaxID=1008307 RepID=UPI0036F1AABD
MNSLWISFPQFSQVDNSSNHSMAVKKRPRVKVHLWDEDKGEAEYRDRKDKPKDRLDTADSDEESAAEETDFENHMQEPEPTPESIGQKLKRFLRENGLLPPKK